MKLSVTVSLICVVVLIGGNRQASRARQRNPASVVLARHEPQAAAISVDETVYWLRNSSFTDVQVAGTWDAQFSGTVEKKGTPHDDMFVMELKQKRSKVTGTLRFEGLDIDFVVSGKVTGTAFSYTSKARLSPNCEATITGETTVEATSGKFKGSQTQMTCEGTAVGQVTAVRR